MIFNAMILLVSVLVAILYYRIEFKLLINKLMASYAKAGSLVVKVEEPQEKGLNDPLMDEVKQQFGLLALILLRFILLVSPTFFLLFFMWYNSIPSSELFALAPILISIIAFILVYLIRKYAGRPTR
jgi:hypothetical protein